MKQNHRQAYFELYVQKKAEIAHTQALHIAYLMIIALYIFSPVEQFLQTSLAHYG